MSSLSYPNQEVDAWIDSAKPEWNDGIQVDSCPPLEEIVVRTRHNVYKLIVLPGNSGEILIQGGRLFPEFRRARLVGATASGHAIKLMGIYVGLRMEVRVDDKSVITSPVQGISIN